MASEIFFVMASEIDLFGAISHNTSTGGDPTRRRFALVVEGKATAGCSRGAREEWLDICVETEEDEGRGTAGSGPVFWMQGGARRFAPGDMRKRFSCGKRCGGGRATQPAFETHSGPGRKRSAHSGPGAKHG